MEHDDAIRSQAAERYVARELSPEEKDAFEEHFFDCPKCAEDVRFEMTFAANVRAALREPAPKPQPLPAPPPSLLEKWRHAFHLRPALAFSFATNIVLASAFLFVVMNGERDVTRPQFTRVYFAPGPAHGAEDAHALAAGDTVYAVRFLSSPNTRSYSYEILDAMGHRESSGALQAQGEADDYLYLQVPVKRLPNGIHTLEVHAGGLDGEMISRSRFQISR